MNYQVIFKRNRELLALNPYPGRGIIIGLTPDRAHYVQVYWIMGRSVNSRNRVFHAEGDFVKNAAFDESKMVDPSLIIYYPIKHSEHLHVVTNGDQTETIMEGIKAGEPFEKSLFKREFEPDPPHYTPRISGIINTTTNHYALSILKTANNQPEVCHRYFYHYDHLVPGLGHCIHTYKSEINSGLTPFTGEPFEVELFNDISRVQDYYWQLLNPDNRISLLVKFIDVKSGRMELLIRNKHEAE